MKKILPILILSAAMLTSCLEGESNYTPSISVSYFTLTTGDTLDVHYNSTGNGFYYLDSIEMGDTVCFAVGFASYTNNMVYTGVTWDKSKLNLWAPLDADFLAITTAQTDADNLQLYYQTGYNYVVLQVQFTPLHSGDSNISFGVESDAQKVGNTNSLGVTIYTK